MSPAFSTNLLRILETKRVTWVGYRIILLKIQGFRRHYKVEHNMWSYMYFMLHLSETDPNDFTALELHVYKMVHRFFIVPINQLFLYHYVLLVNS
jgi:hypothetical protein